MWVADRLLPGYESWQIPLPDAKTAWGEPEKTLRAVLVRRNPPQQRRAILYVHGWNDYFFQTHLADFFAGLGFDFYALDLRRYGRSLVQGQYAGFITAVEEYYVELDVAIGLIREEHDTISIMGHSTGGLTASLYASDRPGTFEAVLLNAPWLELQSASVVRTIAKPLLATLSTGNPVYTLSNNEGGFYHRILHADEEGEWNYDRNLKGDKAFRLRVGWFNAILAGHGRVAMGLEIDCPVFVMTSKRSDFRRTWSEELRRADIVLDVDQIAARVLLLGDHVTLVRVDGAMHDLVLSDEPVRTEVFRQLRLWMTGYLASGPVG